MLHKGRVPEHLRTARERTSTPGSNTLICLLEHVPPGRQWKHRSPDTGRGAGCLVYLGKNCTSCELSKCSTKNEICTCCITRTNISTPSLLAILIRSIHVSVPAWHAVGESHYFGSLLTIKYCVINIVLICKEGREEEVAEDARISHPDFWHQCVHQSSMWAQPAEASFRGLSSHTSVQNKGKSLRMRIKIILT